MSKYGDFRKKAEDIGLIVGDDHFGKEFCYDLNQGEIYGPAGVQSAKDLVELATECAPSSDHGEHLALKCLVAKRADLSNGQEIVNWVRSYHVSNGKENEYISLLDYIAQNGSV